MGSIWGITPQASVQRECQRVGEDTVVRQCIAILRGEDVHDDFLFVIGGPASRSILDGREGGVGGYWPRTWALRALLYAWADPATSVVLGAAADDAWRVREMTAKVIARRQLDDGLEVLGQLVDDPNPRVREAAVRARQRLTVDRSR